MQKCGSYFLALNWAFLRFYVVVEFGQAMAKQGISMLTLNYRGTHKSGGTFGLHNTLEDIQATWAWLHRERTIHQFKLNTENLVLGGYSYGGGMALAYSAQHQEVGRVFSIAGTDHGQFARDYLHNPTFAEMIDTWFDELKFPAGPVHFEGRDAVKELTQNSDPYDLKLGAKYLANRDILLIAGWDDLWVPVESHILPFYRALVGANAQKVQIDAFQDNHLFENSYEQLVDAVIDWILNA
jgi:dienelactone hydrolase